MRKALFAQEVTILATFLGWESILPVQDAGTACNISLPNNWGKLVDVLFGDVWFCSGQSNMEQKMADIKDAEVEIANSLEDTKVRFVDLARRQRVFAELSEEEEVDLAIPWSSVKNTTALASMSAICFLTGRYWQRHLGTPIGLVAATWGGTEIEAWMSRWEFLNICRVVSHALVDQNAKRREALAKCSSPQGGRSSANGVRRKVGPRTKFLIQTYTILSRY